MLNNNMLNNIHIYINIYIHIYIHNIYTYIKSEAYKTRHCKKKNDIKTDVQHKQRLHITKCLLTYKKENKKNKTKYSLMLQCQ